MVFSIKNINIIIDDEDYFRIKNYKWNIQKDAFEKYGLSYFRVIDNTVNPRRYILLHRHIMGCTHKDGKIVDHINGNTLDNRKANLRICTAWENCLNTRISKANKTGFKGVDFREKQGHWTACIIYKYKKIHLGTFKTIEEAHNAYIRAAKDLHGEFYRKEPIRIKEPK